MSNGSLPANPYAAADSRQGREEYVTVAIGDQWFGIPVLKVRDVLVAQKITPIPMAPPEVAGALNLRGRIVTAIDVRRRLGLPEPAPDAHGMSVVVDHGSELYSLIVDSVGEVLSLSSERFERNPSTLDPAWQGVSAGVHQLEDRLLLVLDVARLLDIQVPRAA